MKKAAAPSGPLSEEEKQQRKQLGILFICWGVILPILFDQFILKPYVVSGMLKNPYLPLTPLIVTPVVIGWVLLVYWKKR